MQLHKILQEFLQSHWNCWGMLFQEWTMRSTECLSIQWSVSTNIREIQPRHALDYMLRQKCRVHWDACMYQYNSMVMQIIRTVYNYKLPSFDTYSEDGTISKCHQSPTNYHILWVKIVSLQWPSVPRTMIALAAQESEEVVLLLVIYAPLNCHSVLHSDSEWG